MVAKVLYTNDFVCKNIEHCEDWNVSLKQHTLNHDQPLLCFRVIFLHGSIFVRFGNMCFLDST